MVTSHRRQNPWSHTSVALSKDTPLVTYFLAFFKSQKMSTFSAFLPLVSLSFSPVLSLSFPSGAGD